MSDLMSPREVAALFNVTTKTVSRWSSKHLDVIRTAGGHRRYRREDVEALLAQQTEARKSE